MAFTPEAQAQSLVRELRSHKPCGTARKETKNSGQSEWYVGHLTNITSIPFQEKRASEISQKDKNKHHILTHTYIYRI